MTNTKFGFCHMEKTKQKNKKNNKKIIIKVKVEYEKEIDHCYMNCPYFGGSRDGMECHHPYFNDKGAYANMIISWEDDIQNGFPKKCPFLMKK